MIRVGDFIELKCEKFKRSYSKNKVWKKSYLWKNQFNHVSFWYSSLQKRGEYVKAFFDSSFSKVIKIEYNELKEPLFITTELFWICLPDALTAGEVNIIKAGNVKIKALPEDIETVDNLAFFESEYLKGTFDILERENNKNYIYKLGFHLMLKAGKWN